MALDLPAELRRRARAERVGRFATVRPDGTPHLVPVVFALERDVVVMAVDAKPKSTRLLQRLRNLAENPVCCLLVDGYAEDWSQLWWVRLDGLGRVVRDEPERTASLAPLVAKYPQYSAQPPDGPVVVVRLTSAAWWTAR